MEDRAARDFALSLYADLLGLVATGEGEQPLFQRSAAFRPAMPLPLYAAMRQARIAIAAPPAMPAPGAPINTTVIPIFASLTRSGWGEN